MSDLGEMEGIRGTEAFEEGGFLARTERKKGRKKKEKQKRKPKIETEIRGERGLNSNSDSKKSEF